MITTSFPLVNPSPKLRKQNTFFPNTAVPPPKIFARYSEAGYNFISLWRRSSAAEQGTHKPSVGGSIPLDAICKKKYGRSDWSGLLFI